MNIISINHRPTKDEAAKLLGLKTYDCALPQQWLNVFVSALSRKLPFNHNLQDKIISNIIWSYDAHSISGHPYPLTIEGYALLLEYDRLFNSSYAVENDHEFNVLLIN